MWIDNLADVVIGSHACISQGAYLCTGSHDWSSETFDLKIASIRIGDRAWVGACAVVAPGTVMDEGAVLSLGGIGSGKLNAWTIHYVKPQIEEKPRKTS